MSTPSFSLRTRRRRAVSRRVDVTARPTVQPNRVAPVTAGLPSLRVEGLCRTVAGRRVLDDLHLELAPGERVAVIGAAGSGKSTLLRELRADGPAITIAGHLRLADDATGGSFDALGSDRPDRPSVVLEAHDLDGALAGADRIVVLGQGRILHQLHLGRGPRDLTDPAWVALRDRLAAAIQPRPAFAA